MTTLAPPELRKTLRNRRQQLSTQQQKMHSQQACQALLSSNLLQGVKRIALFLSQDGELSTENLIDQLWLNPDLELYLPALETQPDWHMGFSPYTSKSKMIKNQFNIEEPDIATSEHLAGCEMDLVIMPLVGFDQNGNRMGMGGGYYDRTFEFKLQHPNRKPLLVGWAHSCQQVACLDKQVWDVPLNVIVTENGLLNWGKINQE